MAEGEKDFAAVLEIITTHRSRALMSVNVESLLTYWEIGAFLSPRIHSGSWSRAIVGKLAEYIKRNQPELRGYGKSNLYNMALVYDTFSSDAFVSILDKYSSQLSQYRKIFQTLVGKRVTITPKSSDKDTNVIKSVIKGATLQPDFKIMDESIQHNTGVSIKSKMSLSIVNAARGSEYVCVIPAGFRKYTLEWFSHDWPYSFFYDNEGIGFSACDAEPFVHAFCKRGLLGVQDMYNWKHHDAHEIMSRYRSCGAFARDTIRAKRKESNSQEVKRSTGLEGL